MAKPQYGKDYLIPFVDGSDEFAEGSMTIVGLAAALAEDPDAREILREALADDED